VNAIVTANATSANSVINTRITANAASTNAYVNSVVTSNLVSITDDTTTATAHYPLLGIVTTGALTVANTSSTKLTYVPSTGTLSATSFTGSGSGLSALGTSTSYQVGSFGVGTAASGVSGEIRATNNVTAFYSSDIALKQNIQNIQNALDAVEKIGGKTFEWTDDYIDSKGGADGYFVRKEDFGVIAQDVLEVFPLAVRERGDKLLAVDYEKLVALAFAAIKELKQENENLQDQLDELKQKIK
jgi:hypothetical protein